MKDKFYELLKEYNAVDLFKNNLLEQNDCENIEIYLDKFDVLDWVNAAFNWKNTKQGHDFWCDIDIVWDRLCEA